MSTYVLVHGAWHTGAELEPVAAVIREAGHVVHTPTIRGNRPGDRKDSGLAEAIQSIVDYLAEHDLKDVVLVGTSTGGMVMARAAETARERVARVVFADALALIDGEAVPQIVKRPTAVNTELTTGPSQHDFETRLFADLDPAIRKWAIERCTPHPIAPLTAPVKLERFWSQSWNASVIWCRKSTNPPVAHQRRACETLKGRWHELDTGHYPMLSEPEALATLIVEG